MGSRDPQLQHEHQPDADHEAAAPQTRDAPSAAVATAMRLQHGAGNRAAAARLNRAPAAGSTPMRTPGPASKPAAAGAAPAGAKTPVPGELAKACESLYTALNIGGLSGAKTEQILSTLDANRAQGKALAAAYATTYSGHTLDADLRKLANPAYVRARDYLWFGGLRTMTKILIALAGTGTDATSLMRLLQQAGKEGDPAKQWHDLVADPNNPLAKEFRGQDLTTALRSELSGTDISKARALIKYGQLRPVDKVFIAIDQYGTDEALLFDGLASANPARIVEEFRTYEFRSKDLMATGTDLFAALSSELSGEDYDRALTLLGYERNPDAGMLASGQAAVRKRTSGKLVGLVKAAARGAWVDKPLLWKAIEEATEPERKELAAKVADPADPLGLQAMLTGLSSADLARLRATLGIKEAQGAPGAEGRRGAGTVNLDDQDVKALRALGGVDRSTVFDAIKMSSPAQLAAFRKGWLDTGSAFHAYVARNTSATDQAYLYTVVSTDLTKRIRWCFGSFSDDETYLFHLLGSATAAEQRAVAKDRTLMDLMRSHLSTSEFRQAQALLVPKDATPQEKAAALRRQVAEETGGVMDLVLSTGDAVRDEDRDLQVAAAAAKKPGAAKDPKAQAALAAQVEQTTQALDDYKAARDEFVGAADMVVSTAIGLAATALTGGAAGPAVAAQLARVALAMAVSKVVTQKALKGEAFDILGADGVRAAVDGAVEGMLMMHGALAARGVAVEMESAEAAARQLTSSTYARIVEPAVKEALSGGKDAAIGAIVNAATDDKTWNEGLLAAAQKMATSGAASFAQGVAVGAATHAGGKGAAAVKQKVKARGAAPEPTVAAPTTAGAELALRSPQEWAAMRESLGDLSSRVPIIENPKLDSTTVRVHYGDADGVRMEIGPYATAAHIAQHVATARMLLQYEGPLGKLRQLYEYVRGLLAKVPGYGTAGFEADAEVTKLTAILKDLEARQASIRSHVDAIGAGGSADRELAALEAEMANLQEQLVHHQANVESFAAGRGFIAAEGAASGFAGPPHDFKTLAATERRNPKGELLGWDGIPAKLPPGTVVEFPNGARVWIDPQTGHTEIQYRLGRTSPDRSRAADAARRAGRGLDPGASDALVWEYAHASGRITGSEVSYAIYKATSDVNQKLQAQGIEKWMTRLEAQLPAGGQANVRVLVAPPVTADYLSEIKYEINLTLPDGAGGFVTRPAVAVNIHQRVDFTADRTHVLAAVSIDVPARNDPQILHLLESVPGRSPHTLRTVQEAEGLQDLIDEAAPAGTYVHFLDSAGDDADNMFEAQLAAMNAGDPDR